MSCRVLSLKFNDDEKKIEKERERENLLRYFVYKEKKISKKSNRMNGIFSRISFGIFLICRTLNLFHLSGITFLKQEGTSFSFYRYIRIERKFFLIEGGEVS